MSSFSAGEVIKRLRESKSLTQEQVCLGLCDKGTLSRIESGATAPSSFMLESLFERLGFEASKYFFSVSSKKETELRNELDKIESLLIMRQLDEAEQKLKEIERAEELGLLRSGSAKDKTKQTIISQVLLRNKAAIMQLRNEDPKSILEIVLKATNATIPDFAEENIPCYLLTYREISLLNILASAYKAIGLIDKAIQIFYNIKSSMDSYYTDEYEKSRGYIQTLFNLSNTLLQKEDYTHVIEICDIAIGYCLRNRRLSKLPKLEYGKAYSMFRLGEDITNYRRKLIESYYTLKLYRDDDAAQLIKNFLLKENLVNWEL